MIDFGASNRVRVKGVFEGASLIWTEPEEQEIYIPNAPVVPPWIDENVDHRKKEFTYVDGEWINLDTIEIIGDKTFNDIDLDGDGNLPYHEILVYFAKLADKKIQEFEFALNYFINASNTFTVNLGIDPDIMFAAGLPYLIYYQPAFYSLRFP